MSHIGESDLEKDMMMKLMIEMNKLIQNLYGVALNQQKQDTRHDEHFHKLSQRVYTNNCPQTVSARAFSDSQVTTRSQTRNNVKNLENNKPVTRENPSQPLNVPRRGILKRNEWPLRVPSQEAGKRVNPYLAKPQPDTTMQRKPVSSPSKGIPPMRQDSINANILGKLSGSSVMMSLKGLIAIPSVRIQTMHLLGLKTGDKD